jgi:hypothetical protein
MAVNKIKNLTVYEMLKNVAAMRSKEDKINLLREYNVLAVRDVLKGAFDDTIIFIIPEGTPPYKKVEGDRRPSSSLHKLSKQFRYFVSGGPGERMPSVKVEQMFIRLLESIPAEDAEVVLAMKDKKLSEMFSKTAITKKMVSEAFPGLISK